MKTEQIHRTTTDKTYHFNRQLTTEVGKRKCGKQSYAREL